MYFSEVNHPPQHLIKVITVICMLVGLASMPAWADDDANTKVDELKKQIAAMSSEVCKTPPTDPDEKALFDAQKAVLTQAAKNLLKMLDQLEPVDKMSLPASEKAAIQKSREDEIKSLQSSCPTLPAASATAASAPAAASSQDNASGAAGSCAKAGESTKGTAPKLDQTEIDADTGATVSGTLTDTKAESVRICINDQEVKDQNGLAKQKVAKGKFSALITTKLGDKVTAQEVIAGTNGAAETYGPVSNSVPVGKCSETGTGDQGSGPILDPVKSSDQVSGKLKETSKKESSGGSVRICVEDLPVATATVSRDGSFSAKLPKSLTTGQKVTAQRITSAEGVTPEQYGLPGATATVADASSEFDFGRVRIYLSAGAILSQDQNQFSKTSSYLNFNADNTWAMKDPTEPWGLANQIFGKQLNSSFEARLTSLPVSSCQQTATSNACPTSSSTTTTPNSSLPATFNTSAKSALISGAVYAPNYFKWSSWPKNPNAEDHRYALYYAPIIKGGFQTLLQSATTTASGTGSTTQNPVTTINGQTFFHFYAGGSRFGLYRFHDHAGTSVAPDSLLYLDITYGKFENFATLDAAGKVDHPGRLAMEGRFNIPKYPIFLGFDSNTRVGNSQGDLRFLFGTSFDLGCLLKLVNVSVTGVASCDSKGKSSSSNENSSSSAQGKGKKKP